MGYELVLCKVLAVDTTARRVTLEPLSITHFNTIEVEAGTGLKFMSDYAPYTHVDEAKDEKVFNVPVGFVNYPQPNDVVLAAIWLSDISREDRLRAVHVQNQNMEVIILGKINWNFPDIGTHDNILGDSSGAKIHLNHGWLDTENLSKDAESDTTIHLPTGHTTTVANRSARVVGQKFLPFGIHSHRLGLNGVSREKSTIIEQGETVAWGDAFTQDPTDGALFDDLLSLSKRGSKKFLEPPCHSPGTLMDIHETGYKLLVETDGHVRQYFPKGAVFIIGQDGSNTEKQMAFDPVGASEQGTYPDVAEGVLEFHLISGANTFVLKFDASADQLEITTTGGPGAGLVKIVGDLEVTGDVKGATGTYG